LKLVCTISNIACSTDTFVKNKMYYTALNASACRSASRQPAAHARPTGFILFIAAVKENYLNLVIASCRIDRAIKQHVQKKKTIIKMALNIAL
jgi:hypothetical protein